MLIDEYLQDLNFEANSLTGTMDGLAGIEALIRVRIDHNQLTGTIPAFSSTSLQVCPQPAYKCHQPR